MHYSIVFKGKIRDGASAQETRHNLAGMFNIANEAILDKVFSGNTVVLKKNLSEAEAQKQEMILFMAGAVCEIRNDAPPPPPPPPAPPPTAEEPPPAAPGSTASPSSAVTALAPVPALTMVADPPVPSGPAEPVPAALRGYAGRDDGAEERVRAEADAHRVTNRSRDGLAFQDPMKAPWDPAFMPDGVRGLSWAGFFAPLLWGSFNGLRLSFLPMLGVRVLRHLVPAWGWGVLYLAFGTFYLLKGRELAWENKTWRNGEHFNQVQRRWNYGSVAFFLLVAYGLVSLGLREHHQKLLVAAEIALAQAEQDVAQAGAPDARSSARAARVRARQNLLADIDDPAEREQRRRAFAEQDREEQEEAAAMVEPSSDNDSPPPAQ